MSNQIAYKKGYKYQLVEEHVHLLHGIFPDVSTSFARIEYDKLIISTGYAWDGASGPALDTLNFMRGSLVHDVLYQLMRVEALSSIYRKEADKELVRICREDGMSRFRAWGVYKAVRTFAARSATPEKVRKVYYAPKQQEQDNE